MSAHALWRTGLLLVALAAGGTAAAAEAPTPPSGAAEESASESAPGEAVALDLPTEGLWAWIARMEGEMLSPEVVSAAAERSEEVFAEQALQGEIGAIEVPTGVYRDPAGATRGDPLHLDEIDPSEFDIPIVVNEPVKQWMRYFLGRGRKYYTRWLKRSTRVRPMMYRELEKRKLPRDLVYLSMIESGYNYYATSRVGAVGLWQFMPATGRMYKLRVDWWVDDRRDPLRATVAAAEHLGDLHRMFGDWYLAWGAYNAGPGRIRRAQRAAGGSKDFWTLRDHLPSETDNYIPKLIAAAIIGKHPERYGFTDLAYEPELEFDEVLVDGAVDLEVLARCAGIDLEAFQALNPALRRWTTPEDGHVVRLPHGAKKAFKAELAKVPVADRVQITSHVVARGESLSQIAARYGVSLAELGRVNNIRDTNRIYVGMKLVIPLKGRAPPARATAAVKPEVHVVVAGESLSGIAPKYGVSVAQLQTWNRLSGTTIHPGQRLALTAPAAPVEHAAYKVKPGDSLSAIAARFGVSLEQLKRDNGIRDASRIQVGQTLQVAITDTGWDTYTVKSGDSLSIIAGRHDCTVRDIVAWNELPTHTIQPGQTLRIKR